MEDQPTLQVKLMPSGTLSSTVNLCLLCWFREYESSVASDYESGTEKQKQSRPNERYKLGEDYSPISHFYTPRMSNRGVPDGYTIGKYRKVCLEQLIKICDIRVNHLSSGIELP